MVRSASILFATLLLTGCTSFEKEWAAAPATASDGVAGRWIGRWQNTNNTHGGALRAVVKPDGKEAYTARFHAVWGNHSGSFRTPLPGTFKDGEYHFRGSRRILGVKITTAGHIGTNGFEATYDSAFDRGNFQLQRTERSRSADGSPGDGHENRAGSWEPASGIESLESRTESTRG